MIYTFRPLQSVVSRVHCSLILLPPLPIGITNNLISPLRSCVGHVGSFHPRHSRSSYITRTTARTMKILHDIFKPPNTEYHSVWTAVIAPIWLQQKKFTPSQDISMSCIFASALDFPGLARNHESSIQSTSELITPFHKSCHDFYYALPWFRIWPHEIVSWMYLRHQDISWLL